MVDYSILAPFMFVCLLFLLMSGYPVAFVLGGIGLVFGAIGIATGQIPVELAQAIPERLFGIMKNDTLLSIPFFTLMGLLLEKSGLAEDLLSAINQLTAHIRGGLAYAVIFVGALLAATTGVVAASVMALGLISLPIMLKHGYSPTVSSGVIMASGTLAQIVPPSLVLIILGDTLGVSIKDMYYGALLPSLILIGIYVLYIFTLSVFKPQLFPAVVTKNDNTRPAIDYMKLFWSILPPLLLIFLVLGSIFLAIATPTESGAMGAVGAAFIAFSKKRLSWRTLHESALDTAKLTSFVMFILIGSSIFSLTFRAFNGDIWIEHLFSHIPGGALGFLVVVNVLIFILGMFLDFFEIVFIVIPLLIASLTRLDISPLWFGILIAMNLQTSFLTPPFGFSLFYLRSVAQKTLSTVTLYKGVIPFIAIQIGMVILLCFFPQLVLTDKETVHNGAQNTIELLEMNKSAGTDAQDAIRLMLDIAKDQQSP